MNHGFKLMSAMFVFTATMVLGGCQPQIMKSLPADYSIPSGQVVYVENDGRCAAGKVMKVTGGKSTSGTARNYECVERPQ